MPEQSRELRALEERILRDTASMGGVDSLAMKVLKQAFVRGTPELESYCRIVLDVQPQSKTALRSFAKEMLEKNAPVLRSVQIKRGIR